MKTKDWSTYKLLCNIQDRYTDYFTWLADKGRLSALCHKRAVDTDHCWVGIKCELREMTKTRGFREEAGIWCALKTNGTGMGRIRLKHEICKQFSEQLCDTITTFEVNGVQCLFYSKLDYPGNVLFQTCGANIIMMNRCNIFWWMGAIFLTTEG